MYILNKDSIGLYCIGINIKLYLLQLYSFNLWKKMDCKAVKIGAFVLFPHIGGLVGGKKQNHYTYSVKILNIILSDSLGYC